MKTWILTNIGIAHNPGFCRIYHGCFVWQVGWAWRYCASSYPRSHCHPGGKCSLTICCSAVESIFLLQQHAGKQICESPCKLDGWFNHIRGGAYSGVSVWNLCILNGVATHHLKLSTALVQSVMTVMTHFCCLKKSSKLVVNCSSITQGET